VAVSFTIREERTGATTVLRLAGELDMTTAPCLRSRLDDLISAGRSQILVDLRELTFCDSAGLTTLIQGDRHCTAAGGWLRLTGPSGHVARVLEMSGVLDVLAYRADGGQVA
jgi:anti-sigma B factor antagonist